MHHNRGHFQQRIDLYLSGQTHAVQLHGYEDGDTFRDADSNGISDAHRFRPPDGITDVNTEPLGHPQCIALTQRVTHVNSLRNAYGNP